MKSKEEENTAFHARREQKSYRLQRRHCAVVDLNNWVANCWARSFPWPLQFSHSARSVAESPVFPDPDEESLGRCSSTTPHGILAEFGHHRALWPQCYRFLQANACSVAG